MFKLTEVAEHNKSKGDQKSIWVVIHDKVYDITKFLDEVTQRIGLLYKNIYLDIVIAASRR